MCYSYYIKAMAEKIERRFDRMLPSGAERTYNMSVNGFGYPTMPIIIKDSNQIQYYEWGLIPHWAKDDSIKKYTLNARIETLSEKPSFREAIQQPCLIPASGFYEWQWLDKKGKEKQKYLIQNSENELFAFAGLYSNWIDKETGELRNTYTILTTQANKLMAKIHNTKQRMPVILHPKDETTWLAGNDFMQFAYPYETSLQAFLI